MTDSPLERARNILESVVRRSDQWGKHYRVTEDSEFNEQDILQSIRVVMMNAQFAEEDLSEKALTAVKELRACKAREGKLKKQVESLKEELAAVLQQQEEQK